jgi:AraC-like DNA-binding protein
VVFEVTVPAAGDADDDTFTFGVSPGLHADDPARAAALLGQYYVAAELQASGALGMWLNAARFPTWTTGQLRFGADVRVLAREIPDYHVTIPLSGRVVNTWTDGGEHIAAVGSGAVFSPGISAAVRWTAQSRQVCLRVSRTDLESTLEAMLGRPVSDPVRFARRLELANRETQGWFDLVRLLDRELGRAGGVLSHRLAVENIRSLLVQGLLLVQPHNYTDQLTVDEPATSPETLRRAIDLLQGSTEFPWTTAQLARRTGVSTRALQKAFARAGHPPPMSYLRRLRLHRVRGELTNAAPGVSVTSAAARWGFVHLGRFASQYRDQFGESPSATLRAAQGHDLGVSPRS